MTDSDFTTEPDGRTEVTFASEVPQLQDMPADRAVVSKASSAPTPPFTPDAVASSADQPAGTPASDAPPGRRGIAHEHEELDHIYEQILERLRRDLVVERERAGQLLGGLSWGS